MPVLTGPGCLTSTDCPEQIFPSLPSICQCTTAKGGINDIYIIPCSASLTSTNITDIAWWTTLVNGDDTATPVVPPKLGRAGKGLGSIGKKSSKTQRIASCQTEQIIGITWALKYVIYCFDKTSADATRDQFNALIQKAGSFLAVARMCDGDDNVLPIGTFTLSDLDWVVPDNSEDIQNAMFELSWQEMALPSVITVAGLSAVLPKAA